MSTAKKEEKQASAYIETRNLDELAAKTGNLYKSINVISKRSEQMNAKLKEELHRKLEEFASATDNLEEVFENRETESKLKSPVTTRNCLKRQLLR